VAEFRHLTGQRCSCKPKGCCLPCLSAIRTGELGRRSLTHVKSCRAVPPPARAAPGNIAYLSLAAMEPLMIVFLGVIVGGIIVAMCLPIFDMVSAAG
jgi:hypothetical protein